MPSLKALNSSAESPYKATNTANPSPPSRNSDFSIKTGAESGAAQTPGPRWKLYDNPFFVAAVASAVVEATLNQEQHQQQDGADHGEESVVIPGCEIQEEEAQQEQASCSQPLQDRDKKKKERRASSTPRARESFRGRASPSVQSVAVEVRRKPNVAEDANQKLRTELLNAWTSIQRLDKAETEARAKVERLSRRLEDGKVVWEAEVQDKLTSSLQAMKHKLKEEKGSNRCLELANQKLEQELAETRKAISEARRNVVGERQAKRMIEDVCDELAKEIGDDRAEVMELRRQSSTTRKEAEDARKTLQMGEVWREEKVQTRLVEARFEIEHKSMELDKLISQVQAFLEARNMDLEPFHPEIISAKEKESVELDIVQDKQEVTTSEDRKAHKDHTRLLLNGSGFHMRMKKVQNGGSGRGNAAAAAAAGNGNGGKPVAQRIWPTSIRVDKKSLVNRGRSVQAVE